MGLQMIGQVLVSEITMRACVKVKVEVSGPMHERMWYTPVKLDLRNKWSPLHLLESKLGIMCNRCELRLGWLPQRQVHFLRCTRRCHFHECAQASDTVVIIGHHLADSVQHRWILAQLTIVCSDFGDSQCMASW